MDFPEFYYHKCLNKKVLIVFYRYLLIFGLKKYLCKSLFNDISSILTCITKKFDYLSQRKIFIQLLNSPKKKYKINVIESFM